MSTGERLARLNAVADGHVTLINRYLGEHYGLASAEHAKLKAEWRTLWKEAMGGPGADAFLEGLVQAGITRKEIVAFAEGQEA